ncbi:hypothetical protein BRC2024_PQPTKSFJ_CDS_0242 [Tegunavirus sp. BRC001]
MDILSSFTHSKAAIEQISKKLFSMFEENDLYGIISRSKLAYLEIQEHQLDKNLVLIEIYEHSALYPEVSFEAPRSTILACDESVVELWHKASLAIIEGANTAKALKFLKEFPESDHALVHIIISSYERLSKLGKSDKDIAESCAKLMSQLIQQKYSSK